MINHCIWVVIIQVIFIYTQTFPRPCSPIKVKNGSFAYRSLPPKARLSRNSWSVIYDLEPDSRLFWKIDPFQRYLAKISLQQGKNIPFRGGTKTVLFLGSLFLCMSYSVYRFKHYSHKSFSIKLVLHGAISFARCVAMVLWNELQFDCPM